MAIQFVNNLQLNQNYLQSAAIENLGADPGSGVLGQLIFNTGSGELKVCTTAGTTNAIYSAVGGGVETLTINAGTYIAPNSTGTAADPVFAPDLSAVDGTAAGAERYLTKSNKWATVASIPGTYEWFLQTDSGSGARSTIGSGDIVVLTSGNSTIDITNSGQSASFNLPTTGVTAGSYTLMSATVDTYGRVTNASSGTPPTISDATITLTGGSGLVNAGGAFTLNQAADETITFNIGAGAGIQINTNDVAIDYSGANNIIDAASSGTTIATVDKILYEDATDSIVKEIAVSSLIALAPQGDVEGIDAGTYISIGDPTTATPTVNALGTEAKTALRLVARDSSGYGYVQTPPSGDSTDKIATTSFVQTAVTGLLEFKGGFNANTGDLDSPLTGDLYVDVAILVGDYYVVTTAGNFFGNAATPLTVGDQVICNTAAAVGDSVEGDFVIVQSDTDLATATTVGLASFPTSGGLTVNASGAVALDARAGVVGTYGAVTKSLQITADGKGIITGIADANIAIPSTQVTDFCTAVEACVGTGLNHAANIGNNSATTYAVTHALGTRDVIVQVYDNTTFDTVICDVVRTSTTVVTLSTTTALATNAARVLISVS